MNQLVKYLNKMLLYFGNSYSGSVEPYKEESINRIESMSHTAAAVICSLSREASFQETNHHFMGDVIGLVALLAAVGTSNLSRSVPPLIFSLLSSIKLKHSIYVFPFFGFCLCLYAGYWQSIWVKIKCLLLSVDPLQLLVLLRILYRVAMGKLILCMLFTKKQFYLRNLHMVDLLLYVWKRYGNTESFLIAIDLGRILLSNDVKLNKTYKCVLQALHW